MYVQNKKIKGVIIAEPIEKAHPIVQVEKTNPNKKEEKKRQKKEKHNKNNEKQKSRIQTKK